MHSCKYNTFLKNKFKFNLLCSLYLIKCYQTTNGLLYNKSTTKRSNGVWAWRVVECSPYCLDCSSSGDGKCDAGKCSERTVHDSETLTCKGILTVLCTCPMLTNGCDGRSLVLAQVPIASIITGT